MKFYLIILAVMSLAALILYGADKLKAKAGAWRISEAALLSVGFFGGALGALLGMKLWRHKTRHWYFWVVNIAGLLWQIAVLIVLLVR